MHHPSKPMYTYVHIARKIALSDEQNALMYLHQLDPRNGFNAPTRQVAVENLLAISASGKVTSTIVRERNAVKMLTTLMNNILKRKDYRLAKPILGIIANLFTSKMPPKEKSIVKTVLRCIHERADEDCIAEAFKAMTAALGRPGQEVWWSDLQGGSRFAPRVMEILKKSNNLNLLNRVLCAIAVIVNEEKFGEYTHLTDKLVQEQVVEPITLLLHTAYRSWRFQKAQEHSMLPSGVHMNPTVIHSTRPHLDVLLAAFRALREIYANGPAIEDVRETQSLVALIQYILSAREANDSVFGEAACLLWCLHDRAADEMFFAKVMGVKDRPCSPSYRSAFVVDMSFQLDPTICANVADFILERHIGFECRKAALFLLASLGKLSYDTEQYLEAEILRFLWCCKIVANLLNKEDLLKRAVILKLLFPHRHRLLGHLLDTWMNGYL